MRRVCSELAWICSFLEELHISTITPIPLKCDNQETIYIAKNLIYNERTKHIKVDCHFVCEKLQKGLISLSHVPTTKQLADILTKPLNGVQHGDASFNLRLSSYLPA